MKTFKEENLIEPPSIYMPWWKEAVDEGILYALYDDDTCQKLDKCLREGIKDVKPTGERVPYRIV